MVGNSSVPRPLLKWAGGKTQILAELEENLPSTFNDYYEPFFGGGAFFFHLHKKRMIRRAILADLNRDLISFYRFVRDEVERLIRELKRPEYQNERDTYYSIRSAFNEAKANQEESVRQAARLAFLNKTCFNGLYRVNSKGEFNVPFGRYKNPKWLDEENLRAASVALSTAELLYGDYEDTLKSASERDFVYLDPPYAPLTSTADFTAYTKAGFSFEEQERLARVFRALNNRGCLVLESNSATDEIRVLYQEYEVREVLALRAISSNGDTRGRIPELLIRNYRESAVQMRIDDF